jgi:hypothetical protein
MRRPAAHVKPEARAMEMEICGPELAGTIFVIKSGNSRQERLTAGFSRRRRAAVRERR